MTRIDDKEHNSQDKEMLDRFSWNEFRAIGLLWWVNRMLHLFGWAIVCKLDENDAIVEAYPARCKFRGFDEKSETRGFINLSMYLATEGEYLIDDLRIDQEELAEEI